MILGCSHSPSFFSPGSVVGMRKLLFRHDPVSREADDCIGRGEGGGHEHALRPGGDGGGHPRRCVARRLSRHPDVLGQLAVKRIEHELDDDGGDVVRVYFYEPGAFVEQILHPRERVKVRVGGFENHPFQNFDGRIVRAEGHFRAPLEQAERVFARVNAARLSRVHDRAIGIAKRQRIERASAREVCHDLEHAEHVRLLDFLPTSGFLRCAIARLSSTAAGR